MSSFALVTPSYRNDFERCVLLCESIDAQVTGFERHYLIVDDDCVSLFAQLAGPRRAVLAASQFLPPWLTGLPRWVRLNGRQLWWSWRSLPIDGWAVQQLLKIAAASTMPEKRYCLLDSDTVFFRPFDLDAYARGNPLRLFHSRGQITATTEPHASWARCAHRLLGLGAPSFPADDFITNIILWDQNTVRAMLARVESATGRSWQESLCRARYNFSEYTLYGNFVAANEAHARTHQTINKSLCTAYFGTTPLGYDDVRKMLTGAAPDQVGFSAASFSHTPLDTIRRALRAETQAPASRARA